MTKKEIVKTISEEIGLTQLKTKEIVQKTFDAIVETLVKDGRIELRNFGVFEVKERKPRKARNPRTGEQVEVPAKHVVTFKPGKEMEERVLRLIEIRNQHSTQAVGPIASPPSDTIAPSGPPSGSGQNLTNPTPISVDPDSSNGPISDTSSPNSYSND